MKKRRLASLLLAATLAVGSLAGCGSGGKTAETTAAGPQAAPQTGQGQQIWEHLWRM